MTLRHYLTEMDLSSDEIRSVISRAIELKAELRSKTPNTVMHNANMAMVFEKNSTRTRVSFEAAATQLGGNSIFLAPQDSQLSRGEPIKDTARVLSRMVELIVMRTGAHERIETMAQYADVPVINALSDYCHPCQILADIQTFTEKRGDMQGIQAAWIGDGNNVCHSWMNAARLLDFQLIVATPAGFEPDVGLTNQCKHNVTLVNDPRAAVDNANVVVTDTMASMGQESEKSERNNAFEGYCVDQALMNLANKDALFMHCLPAYRGQEVSEEVLEGDQSVIWDEAENRLHAQKSLIEFLLSAKG